MPPRRPAVERPGLAYPYGPAGGAQMTHTSGLMFVPLFSFTNVPRQPVKVPSLAGAPASVALMMGRLDVTLVASEFVTSPLVPPPSATCPAGHWASTEVLAPLARSVGACAN